MILDGRKILNLLVLCLSSIFGRVPLDPNPPPVHDILDNHRLFHTHVRRLQLLVHSLALLVSLYDRGQKFLCRFSDLLSALGFSRAERLQLLLKLLS